MAFEHLLNRGKIGPMEVRNRIVFPAISNCYCTHDGYVTQQSLDYYEARARGGAGLVILESTIVESKLGPLGVGRDGRGSLSIDHDKYIPGLAELARVIQRHGARAAVQIAHGGREAKSAVIGTQTIAPSAVSRPSSGGLKESDVPREMTVTEIAEMVDLFARAAERAKKAGFDGVEIHGGHWYLLGQFLSPEANQRRDAYGGDVRKRMRIVLEIIEAARHLVGPDYPLWCRINGGGTGMCAGMTPDDLRMEARMLEEAGLHAISISGIVSNQPYLSPMGYFLDLAATAKKEVGIPIIAAGSITPELGEKALAEGRADFIVMGRSLVADPDFPAKLASGKAEDIKPCLRCLQCIHSISIGLGAGPMRCSVNPAAGREGELKITPALRAKKVMVVGGGPAGLEAARVAALRGHQVSLFERAGVLGGQMVLAGKPPHKRLVNDLVAYYSRQLGKVGNVAVHLGQAVTPALIDRVKPDVLVIATGVVPIVPRIPGVGEGRALLAEDVLRGEVETGPRVAVIGGELVGCEVAMFLAEKGKKVTIVELMPSLATRVTPRVREPLLAMLAEKGVVMLTGIRREEFTPEGLVVENADGSRRTVEADSLVLATGARADQKLFRQVEGKVRETYLAGDCVRPENIYHAIHDGFHVALQI